MNVVNKLQQSSPFYALDEFCQAYSVLGNISREISVLQEGIPDLRILSYLSSEYQVDVTHKPLSCSSNSSRRNTRYTFALRFIRIHGLEGQVSGIDSECLTRVC